MLGISIVSRKANEREISVPAAISAYLGVTANGIGVGGLPGILSIKPQFWLIYSLAILVSAVIPLLLTIMVYKYKAERSELPG